jgi:hypothetical protein
MTPDNPNPALVTLLRNAGHPAKFHVRGRNTVTKTSLVRALSDLPSPQHTARNVIHTLKRFGIFNADYDNPNEVYRELSVAASNLAHMPTWMTVYQHQNGATINAKQAAKRLLTAINRLDNYRRHVLRDMRGRHEITHTRYNVSLRDLRVQVETLQSALNQARLDLVVARNTWNTDPAKLEQGGKTTL